MHYNLQAWPHVHDWLLQRHVRHQARQEGEEDAHNQVPVEDAPADPHGVDRSDGLEPVDALDKGHPDQVEQVGSVGEHWEWGL